MKGFKRSFRRHEPRDEGPSEPPERESLLHDDDFDDFEEVDDAEERFNIPIIISLALFAVSAVFFAVQRLWNSGTDRRRELPPRRALVLRLPELAPNKMRGSPDHHLSFVVAENFKLNTDETSKIREEWKRSLEFVQDRCFAVDQLHRRGAYCIGKAYTGTIPFNLIESREETLFRNPCKNGTVTGGENSGSAVLVRASLVDFAIAIDTSGSIAAACCGIIAFKPTHGSIMLNGISLKSDALDTLSFMVKKPQYLSRVGEMLDLPGRSNWRGELVRIFLAKDMFDDWFQRDGKEMFYAIAKAAFNWAGQEQVEEVDLTDFLSDHATGWNDFHPDNVYEALRIVTNVIAKYELRYKICKDCNGQAPEVTEETEMYRRALSVRHRVQDAFKQGIKESKLVVMPALLRPPPSRSADLAELKAFEEETQRMTALATLVGCPQIVFPIRNRAGDLYSVSILSLNKTDKLLIAISEKLIPLIQQKLESEIMSQLHRDRLDNTEERIQERFTEQENQGATWLDIGNERYRDGDYDKAIVAYTEAIRLCPYQAMYYSNRAMAHLKLNEYASAEDDCCKALAIDDRNVKTYLRRGAARKGLGMYVDAIQDFEKVLTMEKNNRQALSELHELELLFEQV